ncbi:probable myosin-binding protein 5 [Cynara cardunculus var. scolymus]|uniref:Zein-binding domain-containing protein n=1 Tax=Cynara cardunculus var. scolymus TaxID=59895 RepID=A0A124SGH0_CYNCS|nr:probable myosin-binding protein 5 [Cynara cardunculus var. scolymus]KVI06363.1 Zein-binding domain-containing protein [Cynara cardunculus var. scolymus]
MASSKRSFKMFVVEELGGFPHFLLWAFLEWILIASLYIDGFLAFISSTFATIFELEPPCVLCTRVDHALVGKDPHTYYNNSICECHKKDISSLAYCHVHRKLSDIQTMCEGCLLSFATEKESDTSTNKSILGSWQNDNNLFMKDDRKTILKTTANDYNDSMLDVNKCSCCGELLKTRAASKGFARSFSNLRALGATSSPRAQAAASSPRAISSTFSPRMCFTPTSWRTEDSRYTELKFVSDTEPDMPEYDFGFSTDSKKDMKSATMQLLPDSEDMNDESCKTPNLIKSNKFFGIPLNESTTVSPRWANKTPKKASSLEKFDTSLEINDESPGDGDSSSLQCLKKQARIDRKNLVTLTMELEEERSAAAVAANNAMAMITRLQAEKAAVQMEALQYQRMMEEQAEYDQEAIQILQDLVAKRDEHMKAMESELESYRERYGELRKVGSDQCEADADEYYQEWRSQSLSSFGEKSESGTPLGRDYDDSGSHYVDPRSPLERDYVDPGSPLEKDYADTMSPLERDHDESGSPLGSDHDHDEPKSPLKRDHEESESPSRRNHDEDGESHSGRSIENEERDTYEESLFDFENEKYQLYSMLKNLENHIQSFDDDDEWDEEDKDIVQENRATLKREVSLIRERLRALEADSGFLKHTAMTLQKGETGTKLLTEIAQHLRKLRRLEDINTTDSSTTA